MLSRARYLFLFDKVVIVCKRRGYSYELKEIIELLFHKMTDDPMNNKDVKKVSPRLPRGDRGASKAGPPGAGQALTLAEGGVVGWPEKAWSGGRASTRSVLGPACPWPFVYESFLGCGGDRGGTIRIAAPQ